ncbi:MAG: hypothetical protein NDJ89_17080 [Oligoflexia bacterium]|nr:hypothetical protein [Oligoflexia bacterium]
MLPITLSRTERLKILANLDFEAKTLLLELEGDLDENSELKKVSDYCVAVRKEARSLTLDLGRIHYVNSPGIRAWIQFISRIQAQFESCSFRLLSESFLHLANQLPEMLGRPENAVESFELPYYCSSCDSRVLVRLGCEDVRSGTGFEPPARKCGTCGEPLLMDEIEQDYFRFLRRGAPTGPQGA